MPSRNKLRIAGSFATLLLFALGLGCKGFFVNPTVSTITIDPPTPTVGFGPGSSPLQLTAAATFSDGSSGTLTGGTSCTGTAVCWSSSDPSVATISTGGLLTGVSVGTSTITAASGSVTGTTTATVAESVSSMTITPPSASVLADGVSTATFTVMGQTQSGSENISSLVTLTASSAGTTATDITCTPGTDNQSCIAASGTAPATYTITVTYGGYTGTAVVTASLVVNTPPS
jgi:hypothetical protein